MYHSIFAALFMVIASTVNATPVEEDAQVFGNLTYDFAGILGSTINASGYRCDSVSSAMSYGNGFRVQCNNYRYTYVIKDVGGNWRIFVK